MAYVFADLTKSVVFRGVELNSMGIIRQDGKPVLVGSQVDSLDLSRVDVVQFTEKLAMVDGMDYGGAWLGARSIAMTGAVKGANRNAVEDAIDEIDAAFTIGTGTFGVYVLAYYSNGARTISCRPNGLSVVSRRDTHGGEDSDPLSVLWSATFTAMNPAIS